ncbi:hypothetical protein, partial [Pantoea sp. GbtcB22]|uniref:hypothetical protein n=1 Tax=Pantoea sp. GbtcB22 TaxID=2824767 RepID=UPI001C2F0EF4
SPKELERHRDSPAFKKAKALSAMLDAERLLEVPRFCPGRLRHFGFLIFLVPKLRLGTHPARRTLLPVFVTVRRLAKRS